MSSPAGAATMCDGIKFVAPATAMPIVAVAKSRRRLSLISSDALIVRTVEIPWSSSKFIDAHSIKRSWWRHCA